MSYLALYRKYRPTTFDELVEQSHISTTLKNQIMQNRIGHAYLFTGTRGTGKTSVAKIFAKAVSCENPINGSPCGKCATCVALSQTDNMDIIEIDAASNNGVDDLRDLRDKVQFQPVIARYKVYIIDEVHMLSISAFNALLKTLEEPPKHVIFILATTEVHKIPATILSRCMRFDFRLISTEKIYEHVKSLYEKVGKEAEDEALYAIARAGDGSMRDALSIADICLSVTDGKLMFDDVTDIVGNLSRESLEKLFVSVVNANSNDILTTLDEQIKGGKNIALITRDMSQFVRDLLVLKMANDSSILSYPKDVVDRMVNIASGVEQDFLLRSLDILGELDSKFKFAPNPRTVLETALLKMANAKNDLSIGALLLRIKRLEKACEEGKLSNISNSKTTAKITPVEAVPKQRITPIGEMGEDGKITLADEGNFPKSNRKERVKAMESVAVETPFDDEPSATPFVENQNTPIVANEEVPKTKSTLNVKGSVMRNLRESGQMALYMTVKSAEVNADNKGLAIISCQNDGDKELLMEKARYDVLKQVFSSYGYDKIEIKVKSKTDNTQEKEKVVERAKKLVGDLLQVDMGEN